MFRYTVRCTFVNNNHELAAQWVDWLREEHLADVIAAGAQSAEIVKMDADPSTYEVRYRFASRAAYDEYERDHAERLRAEGLARFPPEAGLRYERTTGQVI